ncbi:MAG: glycosyltransferase [Planctomycetes bacterium]|nr:glycosyltransferase [Planctomycetota bacterium]
MRLLYVIHQFFPDCHSGTEQICLAMAREARRRGAEVVVLSLHWDWGRAEPPVHVFDQPYDGFRVIRLNHWVGLNPDPVLRDWHNPHLRAPFARVLEEVHPDVVHFFHLRQLGIDLLLEAQARGVRTLVQLTDFWFLCPRFTLLRSDGTLCQGPPDEGLGCVPCDQPGLAALAADPARVALARSRPLAPADSPEDRLAALVQRPGRLRAALAAADAVVAPSRFLADVFARNGVAAERMHVVPYGLEAGRVPRAAVTRPRTPLRLGFVGVFSPWKAAHVLIEAVRQVPGALQLTLHGRTEEPLFAEYIARLRALAGDDPRIVFAGPFAAEDAGRVFADMDLLVVPSTWYENTPLVVLEAFTAGVPVLASDLGGMTEVVRAGQNGFLFPPGDVAALATLLRGLRDDPARLARLHPEPLARIGTTYAAIAALYSPAPAAPARAAALPPDPWLAPLLPLLWCYAGLVLALLWLADLLATPWVLAARARARAGDRARAAPPARLDASVIVLNWNGRHHLQELLPSLRTAVAAAPGDHEVIVVDNGSDDGSAAWVEREHPWARVVRLPENRFFIRGNRAGVAAATRDVLVFVNNDMRVEPAFLRALLARVAVPGRFAATGRIHLAGPRVETGLGRALVKKGLVRLLQVEPADQPGPALWAGGGSSAFDRKKYLALGGFEDLYEPCYVEDVSLSYRAWKRGYDVAFEPAAEVHHAFRATSLRVFGPRRLERIDRRNRELFFWRAITDPELVLAHAAFLPWNAWKEGRSTGLATQLLGLLAALPRLPRALLLRQQERAHAVRSDREVFRLSGSD